MRACHRMLPVRFFMGLLLTIYGVILLVAALRAVRNLLSYSESNRTPAAQKTRRQVKRRDSWSKFTPKAIQRVGKPAANSLF
jgi:hypothetical protein